ncbi:hypothetical protein D3C87_1411510 [compost metagenome]
MFEGDLLLAIGVGDFLVVLPLAQQERFALCFRRHLHDAFDVACFHGEDQVSLLQQFAGQLPAFVVRVVAIVFAQDFQRGAVHGFVHQGVDAC